MKFYMINVQAEKTNATNYFENVEWKGGSFEEAVRLLGDDRSNLREFGSQSVPLSAAPPAESTGLAQP